MFLSPVGSVERKGSSPLSRSVCVGSEQSCQARASPSLCSLDAKADACVPLRASPAVPISRQPPPCSALQTVSSWLSHLCHIPCSVGPAGDLPATPPQSVSCGGSTLFSPLEFRVPSRWCCPPHRHPGAILMPSWCHPDAILPAPFSLRCSCDSVQTMISFPGVRQVLHPDLPCRAGSLQRAALCSFLSLRWDNGAQGDHQE